MDARPDEGPRFRLIELLVAVGAVLLLGALIWPAMQRAREQSQRMECVNSLKQIGLGLSNYAGTYNDVLPPLSTDRAEKKHGDFNSGILLTMLPFVESQPLFKHAMLLPECTWYAPAFPSTVAPFSTTPPGASGPPLSSVACRTYCCPGDSTVVEGMSANQNQTHAKSPPYCFPWAAASYAANYQVFGTINNFGAPGYGNYCGPKYDLSKIPDGAGNTVFFGEQFAACGESAGNLWVYPGIGNFSGTAYTSTPGARAPVGVGDSIVNTSEATNSYLWAPVFANSNKTYGFITGGVGGSITEHALQHPAAAPLEEPFAPGQFWDAPPQVRIGRWQCDKARLQSNHAGCSLVGMGDASVRVVAAGVSQATWHAAIVPDDRANLGDDW
jgi:hypothetical protein